MAGSDLEHVFRQILETEAMAERRRAEIDAIKVQLCTFEEEIHSVSTVLRLAESNLAEKRRVYDSLCVDRDCAEVRRVALTEQAGLLRLTRDDAIRLLTSIREHRFSAYRDFCRQAEMFEELYGLNEACRRRRAAEVRSRTAALEATRQSLLHELRQRESEEAHQLELLREISSLEAEVSRLNAQATGARCRLERTQSMIVDAENEKLVEISKYQKLQTEPRLGGKPLEPDVRRSAFGGHFEIELEEDEDDREGSGAEMQAGSAMARSFNAATHESARLRTTPAAGESVSGRLSQLAAIQPTFAAGACESLLDRHGEEQPPVARIQPMTSNHPSHVCNSGLQEETASLQKNNVTRMSSNRY